MDQYNPLLFITSSLISAISTGICIRTLARPHRPVCKCGQETDILHDRVCTKVAQAARHDHVRDIIAKYLRQAPFTDVITEPRTSEGSRRNDMGIRGTGGRGRRDIDCDVKVYPLRGTAASRAGLARRRREADTDPVKFIRAQFGKFLTAVERRAEANRPDFQVAFKPLVISTGA